MIKPAMPNIPGMGAMTETMDFVKNLWGGMSTPGLGIPGMVMPTLSVEEIDKQIKDLKAVEQWLNVNMNMLRGTIQALEVQSATITTLQSMGQSLSAAVAPKKDGKATSRPFGAAAREAADQAAAEQAAATKVAQEDAQQKAKTETRRKSRAAIKEEFTASDAQAANPALWWNMLQDQFKQAVSTAMTPEAMSSAARTAMKSMTKSAVKTVAKKAVAKRKPAVKRSVSR